MPKKGGKKDKKPVIPPGMSEDLFRMSQDAQMLVFIFKGALVQLKEKPPVNITKGQAAQFLWQLALSNKAKRDEMIGMTVWTGAISLISNGDRLDQTPSVGLLNCLSQIEDWRMEIAQSRATMPCVGLLGSTSPTAEMYSCWTLRNLCETPESRKKVVKDMADWVPLVKVLVEATIERTKGEAARILELCLTHGEDTKSSVEAVQEAVVAAGGVNALLCVIKNKSSGAAGFVPRERAVCCLKVITPREEVKADIMRLGGVEPLVELLAEPIDLVAKAAACEVLWHLTAMKEERLPPRPKAPRASLIGDEEGVGAGAEGGEGGGEMARPTTAASMCLPTGEIGLFTSVDALANDIPACRDKVIEERVASTVAVGGIELLVGQCAGLGGVPPLVLRQSVTPDAGAKKGKKGKGGGKKGKKGKEPPLPAGMADCQRLRHLAQDSRYQKAMVQAGAVRVLVPLLQSKLNDTSAPKYFNNCAPMRPMTAPAGSLEGGGGGGALKRASMGAGEQAPRSSTSMGMSVESVADEAGAGAAREEGAAPVTGDVTSFLSK